MPAPRVRVNSKAARELLKSLEVQADLRRRTRSMAASAGEGVFSEVQVGRNRARGRVWTATTEARVREATDRALTRSLDAGRL